MREKISQVLSEQEVWLWGDEFTALWEEVGSRFWRCDTRRQASRYVRGLLGRIERKNSWQMAEYLGETTPYALQQFIYRGRYSADELRDMGREYVTEYLGDEDGVLVGDETGFIKKGNKSCGVARQYSGTAGKIENCQIGVFLTYASEKGHCPIDRRMYLPKEWTKDSKRMKEAGVPEEIDFRTKPQLALRMVKEATQAGVPYRWFTGDCVYGDNRVIREWLERNQKSYVLCLSRKEYINDGKEYASIGNILDNIPEDKWFAASCGDGTKGMRIYDWFIKEVSPPTEEGFSRWLLVRRNQDDYNDLQAYICFALTDTPKEKLINVAGIRWTVEMCFEESKSEVGLDEYEFRSYNGWYKHITFSCLALALLTVLSSQSMDAKPFQDYNPSESGLDGFKKGRNPRV